MRDDELDEARFNGMAKFRVTCPWCHETVIVGCTGWKQDSYTADRKCRYCSHDFRFAIVIKTMRT